MKNDDIGEGAEGGLREAPVGRPNRDKPLKCKARQGNAKRVRSGILAENTAVLAGDFKINLAKFLGPSVRHRPGPTALWSL